MKHSVNVSPHTTPPAARVCCLVVLAEFLCILGIAAGCKAVATNRPGQARVASASASDSVAESSESSVETEATEDSGSEGEGQEQAPSEQLIGVWEDHYQGRRVLTLKPDGTGVMEVYLEGVAATLFAPKLTFQEEWSIDNDRITMVATGGEPAGTVSVVLRIYGEQSTQRIVDVTDRKMVLVEEPSGKRFEWERIGELSDRPAAVTNTTLSE